MKKIILLILLTSFANSMRAVTIDGKSYISLNNGRCYFALSDVNRSASLFVSSKDYPGVIRALNDLKTDIGRVTGNEPSVVFDDLSLPKEIVIVGTLGKNQVIDQLVKNKKLDVKDIAGKWNVKIFIKLTRRPIHS